MKRGVTGRVGEHVAELHLTKQGLSIVDRNFRSRQGEIDLIATDGDELVFVEVRTRATRSYGSPEESLTRAKQQHMVRCALAYLALHPAAKWRIDVIAIELDRGRVARIDHYKHALQ